MTADNYRLEYRSPDGDDIVRQFDLRSAAMMEARVLMREYGIARVWLREGNDVTRYTLSADGTLVGVVEYTEYELPAAIAAEAPQAEESESDTSRIITGTHYTQADRWSRDYHADVRAALATDNPLMHLWGLGYDVSQARVVTVGR